MKHQLYTQKPRRLFAFGCSFTNYVWITWPEILAHSLDCELYNFATPLNSNNLIFNTVMQADSYFNFNSTDLVMICWSGILRDAKFVDGSWRRTSGAHNFHTFGDYFFKNMVDPLGYLIETLAFIKGSTELVDRRKSQFHQFSMSGILIDEFNPKLEFLTVEHLTKLKKLYQPYMDRLYPSMCQVLNGDQSDKPKIEKMQKFLGNKHYMDGHPTPDDHLMYLEKMFDIQIQPNTKKLVYGYLPGMYDVIKRIDFSEPNIWDRYPSKMVEYKNNNYIIPNLINNLEFWSKFYHW